MGVHKNIGYDVFPKQGQYKDKPVEVCFKYETDRLIPGVIVRDDMEDPFLTIIRLEDGRYIRSTECQYHPVDRKQER